MHTLYNYGKNSSVIFTYYMVYRYTYEESLSLKKTQ